MIIKLEHDGKSWSYDDETLDVLQAIVIEEHIKGTLVDFDKGLGEHRAVCYQALGWLVFHDGNPKVPIGEVNFPVAKLSTAWLQARLAVIEEMKAALSEAEIEAREAEAKALAARPADPTGGPGTGPRSGSTSARSRSASGTGQPTSTPSGSPSSST